MTESLAAGRLVRLENRANLLVKGAGAAALAALTALAPTLQGRRAALILTGGNIDAGRLAAVLAREMG